MLAEGNRVLRVITRFGSSDPTFVDSSLRTGAENQVLLWPMSHASYSCHVFLLIASLAPATRSESDSGLAPATLSNRPRSFSNHFSISLV
jgi:hypothetical protein